MKKVLLVLLVISLGFASFSYAGQNVDMVALDKKMMATVKNSQKTGKGTETWSNGDKYVGSFKNEKKDGQGTYTFSNGKKYVGLFKNGKSVKGILYSSKGIILKRFY